MRTAESVVFTDWPPGPVERYTSMRKLVGIDGDLHLLHLRQHGHGDGGGVDAARRLGHGHTLHPVDAGFVLEHAVGASALDLEDDLFQSTERRFVGRQHFDLIPQALGVFCQHAGDLEREQGGFVAPGGGTDLHDGALRVPGVRLDGGGPEGFGQTLHSFAGFGAFLHQVVAHLGIEARLLEHRGGVGFGGLGGHVLRRHAMGLRQIGVGFRRLGIPAGVIEDRRVGELPRQSLVFLLYLADEPFDHPPNSSANRNVATPLGTGSPPASTRSTSLSTAMATSTSSASGSRVVRRCRARPGHDTTRANLPVW